MITVGIDVGSTTVKAVLLKDGVMAAHIFERGGSLPARAAEELYERLLAENGLTRSDVSLTATTGYGRRLVDFGDMVMTEIKACVTGVKSAVPSDKQVRTIIDVGGQDTKVIALDDDGGIEDFSMNDKCAAGTGRFLEVLAHRLEMTYEEFVAAAAESDTEIHINSTCAVFAESEIVGLLARSVSKANLSAAAHDSIAYRIASMVRRVGRRGAFCFIGGGASNAALVRAVEENLNEKVIVPQLHLVITALGAAIEGKRKIEKRKGGSVK